MSLLLVRKIKLSFATVLLLCQNQVFAETFLVEGRSYYPADISEIEACENARLDAKMKAMSEAGLERGRFFTLDICSESSEGAHCSLIQESQSYFDGGYIKSQEIVEKQIINTAQRECIIRAKFDVQKFETKPDLNFLLEADLNQRKFFSGQKVVVSGNVNPSAYIYLLDVNTKTDMLSLIVPNDYDKQIFTEDEFQLPSRQKQKFYDIYAYIPEDRRSDELSEFMILLATKQKFDLLTQTSASNFYKRLDELGRSNWRKIDLGYTIYRN